MCLDCNIVDTHWKIHVPSLFFDSPIDYRDEPGDTCSSVTDRWERDETFDVNRPHTDFHTSHT